MEGEETRHGMNAVGTHKLQLTFRGSVDADVRLWSEVKAEALRDNVTYADVVRRALREHFGL